LTSDSFSKKEKAVIGLAIYAHVVNLDKPILGICFGFQLLNLLYGGEIETFGRLVCERVEGLHYCFNDYIRKQGHGFRVRKRVLVDGRRVIVHVTKENIVGYLFHSEATVNDRLGYIKRFVEKHMNKN
jgi:anthranilate/para-aminobenzoate synthase component II